MTIESFSGSGPWHPAVLMDTNAEESGTALQIVSDIHEGRCPRCQRPLPTGREFPAGSRITACRSIPICGQCGEDEAHQAMDAALYGIGHGVCDAGCWPVPVEEIEERRARFIPAEELRAEVRQTFRAVRPVGSFTRR